ncbi:MAG: hypothetical protein PHH32_06435 [Eubacteriales bacterium]|nr:hypothetical protein [Eubacteriales bacterium]
MNKRLLAIVIILAALALTACQPAGDTPAADTATPTPTAVSQPNPMDLPTDPPVIEGVPEGYDPASEEDAGLITAETQVDELGIPLYAGATPIPLDPIDMPTPTPRQALTFTYTPYTATNLGLTFESAAGYTVDDSQPDTYILTEPPEQMKDNVSVQFVLQSSTVAANYALNSLSQDVRTYAADLGKVNYKEWRLYDTAERTLMGQRGYYINYRCVMHDDTVVRGRVHMALMPNNRVLMLHFVCPANFNSDYTGVYSHIRDTIKAL